MIGCFQICQTIGQGSEAKIKLAVKNNELYAAKIYCRYHNERKSQNKLQKEVKILKKLKLSPHIIQYVEDYANAEIQTKNNRQYQSDCIILEYCQYGSLFDWIEGTGRFNEILSRTIFLQLVQSVQSMHQNDIYHFDLKLENILLTNNFFIKITDFGLAQDFNELLDNNQIIYSLNSNNTVYHSPEIIEQKQYKPEQIDVFALGVVLFIIYTGHLPFIEANIHSIQDKYYKLIYNRDYNTFWQIHSKNKGRRGFFSDSFKNLIEGIFEYNIDKRFSISDILNHPWINQQILSNDDLEREFQDRKFDFLNYQEEIKIQKSYFKKDKINHSQIILEQDQNNNNNF